METHPGTPPTQAAPPGVSFDGQTEAPAPPAQTGRRRFSRHLVIPLAVLGAVLLLGIAYRYWYTTTHFVWTDNAQVAGPIIQVGSLNAGQVTAVLTDVGQHVEAGQVVARVAVPEVVGAAPSGTAKLGFTDTQSQLVDVTAPVSGVVVARMADPGSTVAAGQPILAVVDPTRLYVTANVNEADIHRIRVGDPVDVTVDSLGMTLPGRVEAIARASAGSFSLIPQQNSTANFTKVAQVVPVKIAVDYGNLPLVVGTSVEVNIHVQ